MALRSVSPAVAGSKPKKLLEQTRDVLRLKHYSLRTERSYCDWIKRFIHFHQLRHPKEMGASDISTFLTHLARIGNVSASTQNQALSALLFLYQQVLKQDVGWISEVERAKRPKRVPVVLTRDEVHKMFAHLHGMPRLMAGLLYGSGLRLMECVRLRVKGFRLCPDHGPRRKRSERSCDDVAREYGGVIAATFGESKSAA